RIVVEGERACRREGAAAPERHPDQEHDRHHDHAQHPRRRRHSEPVARRRTHADGAHPGAPVCRTVSSTSQPSCTVWPGTIRAAWAPNWSYFSTSPSQRSKTWRRTAPKYSTAVQRAVSRLACRCEGASVICSARTEKDTASPSIGAGSGGRG